MMNNRSVYYCSYTIGDSPYSQVAELCRPYGKRALLIGGEKAMAAALPRLQEQLSGSGIKIVEAVPYGKDCTFSAIHSWADYAKMLRVDMIFGMGGGRALDTAKGAAEDAGLPVFTFPTSASTCAATSALSVVYREDGSFEDFYYFRRPPCHCFIDLTVISQAPWQFLQAGMGDTMAKHYESTVSSRGHVPAHSDAMGITLSSMCATPIVRWGQKAMEDCKANTVTNELTEVVLGIIISTGFVSNFVQVDYTTGMAHAVYNGFTVIPSTEHHGHLHGEVVAYGILVLLTVDKQYEERDKLYRFSKSIGLPTCLADIHATPEDLRKVTDKAMAGIDLRCWPYPVDADMLIAGIMELEEYNKAQA